jgi:hypothetical protein
MPPKQKKRKKKGGNIGKHNAAAREDAGEVASRYLYEILSVEVHSTVA